MKAIAIIPARGGSRRIPGKNKKLFHGLPIITYSIRTAVECDLFDRIIVSTDDEQIAAIATAERVNFHWRSDDLCRDEVGTQEVARAVLKQSGEKPDYVCVIYPCAPMMTAYDLARGLALLHINRTAIVFAVHPSPFRDIGNFYWCHEWAVRSALPPHTRSETAPSWMIVAPYWSSTLKIPRERAIDINTPEDWEQAEKMYAALHPSTHA